MPHHRSKRSSSHLFTLRLLLLLLLVHQALCALGMIDNSSSPIIPTTTRLTSTEPAISPDDASYHSDQSRDCQPSIPGCVCFRAIADEEEDDEPVDDANSTWSNSSTRSLVIGDWRCGLLSTPISAAFSSSDVINFPVELSIIGKGGENSSHSGNTTDALDVVDKSTADILCRRLRKVRRLTVIGLQSNRNNSLVEDMIECLGEELVELTVRGTPLTDVFKAQRHQASPRSKDTTSADQYRRMNLLDLSQNFIVSFDVELATSTLNQLEVLDLSENRLSNLTAMKRCRQSNSPESNATSMELPIVQNLTDNAAATTSNSTTAKNFGKDGCPRDAASEEPAALRSLNASRNRIGLIETGVFDFRFQNLVSLDLSFNSLTTIANQTFVDLYALRVMNLSHNLIEDIDVEAFSTTAIATIASTLQTAHDASVENDTAAGSLTIQRGVRRRNTDREEQYYIRLASCTSGWLDIQVVDLSYNYLTELREGVLELALCAVRRLLLSHNRLDRLPRYLFEHLPYLQTLDLSDNLITWLDVGAFTNPSLESLNLSGNRLRKIVSMTFLYLPAIRRIDLARNEISYIYKFAFYRMCSPNEGAAVAFPTGDWQTSRNTSFGDQVGTARRFEIALNENNLGADAIWKILTTFEHLESPGCLVDVDLHDNQIERFIPSEPLSFVQKRIEEALANDGNPSAVLSAMQLFRRWDHVTIGLERNRIQCDCALVNEIKTVDQVVSIVANSSASDAQRNDGLTMSWYDLNCSAPQEFVGISVRQFIDVSASRCRPPTTTAASFCPGNCTCVKNFYHFVDNVSSVTMNCSGRHLTDLLFITSSSSSSSIFHRVHTLDLSKNSFDHVEPDLLRRFLPALRVLYLHDNRLTALPPVDRLLGQLPVSLTLFGNPLTCTTCDDTTTIAGDNGRYDVIDWNRVTCSDGRHPVSLATSGRACATVIKSTRSLGGSRSSPSDMVAVVPKTVLIVSLTLAIILVVLLIVTVVGLVTWSADGGEACSRYCDVGSAARRGRFHFVDAVACRHLTAAGVVGGGGESVDSRFDQNYSVNFAVGGNGELASDHRVVDRDVFVTYCGFDADWIGSHLLPVLRHCRSESEKIRLQSFDSRAEVESRQFLGDFRQNLDECGFAFVVVSRSFANLVLDGYSRSDTPTERPEVLQLIDRHCRRSTGRFAFILINSSSNVYQDDGSSMSLVQGLLDGTGSTSCLIFSNEDENAGSFQDRLRHFLMPQKQFNGVSRRKSISGVVSSWGHWMVEAAGGLRRHFRQQRRSTASAAVEANEKLISASTLTERY